MKDEEFGIAALTILIAVASFVVGYHLGKSTANKPNTIESVKQ